MTINKKERNKRIETFDQKQVCEDNNFPNF